jgi:[ribosomal protein S5]-alanine N-acetyltransferase
VSKGADGRPGAEHAVAVREAALSDLDSLAPLFDEYRQFQGQASDLAAAREFLRTRFERAESIVFTADAGAQPAGFAQLYPSFSSVSLRRVFILNDLFVAAAARRKGVATALLAALERGAWQLGAGRITLNVARSNGTAQALYESRGWRRDGEFLMYHRHASADTGAMTDPVDPLVLASQRPAGRDAPANMLSFSPAEAIEAPRVIVRLARAADVADLLDVNGDPEVTALLPYAAWTSLADGEAWYERMARLQAAGSALQFVVVARVSSRAIGTCLLFRHEPTSARAELGYVLGRAHWQQGLMHEALTALLSRAFAGIGLRRIEAEVDPRNRASAALLGRLGFTREGLLRQRWVRNGEPHDVELHGLLRDEWRPAIARPGRSTQ